MKTLMSFVDLVVFSLVAYYLSMWVDPNRHSSWAVVGLVLLTNLVGWFNGLTKGMSK